jgi:drug/metabolite transporter (DMT)-like permease
MTGPRAGRPSTATIWLALGAVYFFWGTTYLGIETVNRTIPSAVGASARFLVAGTLMYLLSRRRTTERPTKAHWRSATVIGCLLLLGGNTVVAWSERTVPTGTVSLIIALVPLWLALFDRVLLRSAPLGWRVVVGLVMGFAGAALLVGGSATVDGVALSGLVLALVASLSWACGSLYARKAPLPQHPLMASSMQQLAGGVVILLVAVATGEMGRFHPSQVSRASLLGLAYLIVFGSGVAFSAYLWLLRNARTSLVSTYAYVNPVVAVSLGSLVLHETLTPRVFVAGGVVLASVAMIVSAGGARREDAGDPAAGELLPDSASDAGEQRVPQVEAEVGLQGGGGAQQGGLSEDGGGELQPDREPG